MAFFSSLSLPKLPFPGEPWGSPELAGPLGTEPPHELWDHQCVGEILGLPRSWVSRRKPGEGPSGHAPTGWGGRLTALGLFSPFRAIAREREEGDQMWGWEWESVR